MWRIILSDFRLFHIFSVDRRTGIEYTMDEAILCSWSGQLQPLTGTQILSLRFYAAHAGLSGVFFFQSIRKKLGNSISFSVRTYHMVAVNDCSVLSSCASHTHRRYKPVPVHLSLHNGHYAVIRIADWMIATEFSINLKSCAQLMTCCAKNLS